MASRTTHRGVGVVEVPPSRLNPTDAALWDIEHDPNLRTTIVGAMVLDRPVEVERLRDILEVATRRIPRFRQRVVARVAGLGTPHWELLDDFDLSDHIGVVAAPDGVDDALIAGVASTMAGEPFDRTRPLWELAYLDPPSGRSAVLLKVHHSLTDGVGGIDLLDAILDRRRRVARPDLDAVPVPVPGRRPPRDPEELPAGIRRAVDAPWDVASAATTAVFHPLRTATGTWEAARSAGRLLAPTSDPLSPLLTGRSVDRDAGFGDVDLHRMHDAAARHGCTINHAFFAGAVGGLTAYHRELGADLRHLRVTMPISFRRTGDDSAGNQWAPVRFVVPTDIDDPVDRLLAMQALVVASRRERALSFSHRLAGLVQVLPAALSSGVVGGMMHGVDVTLTNVPGLADPHYLAGAAVERLYAFAPTAGAALNVGLVSHLGTACIGTLSDSAAVTEPMLLNELLIAGIEDVVEAAESRTPLPAATGDRPVARAPGSGAPDRLTALDTGFLRLESDRTPMHIGGVFVLDGAGMRDEDGRIRIEDARRHVAARLEPLPRFRRRVVEVPFGLGRPEWEEDDDFDIARHVRVVDVGGSGNRQDLFDLCAELYAVPLDRRHPLWELALVDGLADGSVGIVERVHHALIDGVSGVELAAAVFDLEPADTPDRPTLLHRPVRTRAATRRLFDAIAEQATDPLETGRSLVRAARSPGAMSDQVSSAITSARHLLGWKAPTVPFNGPIGTRRELRAVTTELDDVRRAAATWGGTVNDVVLGAVGGAMRDWFDARDLEPVDVHVLVPVSTRVHAVGEGPGNEVGAVLLELPVAEPDPRRRFDIVHERMARLKQAHEGEGTALLLAALDHLPAPWYRPLVRLVGTQSSVNVVVTNVPGAPVPLHFLGSRIEEIVPVVPLGARLGLGVAVLSYAGRLTISLFADPDAFDDLDALARSVAAELELVGASAAVSA